MLIFIENTPKAYAWGSRDALPDLLGAVPTGEPQAELWLGSHPGAPAQVAKASPTHQSLIELIESDPGRYGVDGGSLPFLLKVLAIGGPLSLQVHPTQSQAAIGFAREDAAGIPRDASIRNYGDENHKPELLVALSEVTALSGFRALAETLREFDALAAAATSFADSEVILGAKAKCVPSDLRDAAACERARIAFLEWALGQGNNEAVQAAKVVSRVVTAASADGSAGIAGVDDLRLTTLAAITNSYPNDPGLLVSLLLHVVGLQPGEAIFLGAQQLHAYISGFAVEVMAASDNVLRAGLTEKHIDVAELLRVVSPQELADPRCEPTVLAPGLLAWQPDVPDFTLMRARLYESLQRDEIDEPVYAPEHMDSGAAAVVNLEAKYPIVLVVTNGRIRIERFESDFSEVASIRRGQSLYISAGASVELSGCGEAYLATVGSGWGVSQAFK